MDNIEQKVLKFIGASSSKTNFVTIKKFLQKDFRLSSHEIKEIISNLILSRKLYYTSRYGTSFIERSYDCPVVISENVVIKPPFCTHQVKKRETVLSIEKGSSFGCGDHPSTRLAIQLIDFIFTEKNCLAKLEKLDVLDIGTGSGVLAILSAKMGAESVCGIDTDPCAVFEAERNVLINGVGGVVNIIDGDLDRATGTYNVVLANIRTPSLLALRDTLEKRMRKNVVLVFSGLKMDEVKKISCFYKEAGFYLFKQVCENDWAACCLLRGDLISKKP